MTDRVQAFIVTLDDDYRIGDRYSYPSLIQEDGEGNEVTLPTDADFIAHAIRSIKGVVNVEPVIADMDSHIARERVMYELRDQVLAVFRDFKRAKNL